MTTEVKIGTDGGKVQLTTLAEAEWLDIYGSDEVLPPRTTLLTLRCGKDTDLTEQQLRDLAAALVQHADFIAQGEP